MFHKFAGDPHSSWRRFLVLGVFCFFSCSNAMQWLTYGAVPTQIKAYYGITTTQLNMLSTVYMIVYIALALLSCLGLERIGLRWCMLLGTGLNFAGSILKLVVGFPSDTYTVIMISQFLNACAQIFVLSVPPSLALVWYKESDRGSATAVGSASNAFGCALGMLIPPLWVKEGVDLSDGLNKLFGFQLAICGIAFFGTIFLVPSAKKLSETEVKGEEGDERQIRVSAINGGVSGPTTENAMVEISPMSPYDLTADEEAKRALRPSHSHLTEDRRIEIFSPNEVIDEHQQPTAKLSDVVVPTSSNPSPDSPTGLSSIHNNLVGEASSHGAPTVTSAPIVVESALVTPDDEPKPEHDPESWQEVFKGIWRLISDRDSLLCELGLSISVGSVWAVNTLLAQLLAPINISEGDAGQMGFWNIIGGTIVAIISGWLVDRYRVYKWPQFGLALWNLLCISFIIMIYYLDNTQLGDPVQTSSKNGIYALNVIAGIPQNVITPVGFEFLMELTYGNPESISGGLLMALANTVSLIEVQVGSALLGDATIAPKPNALNCFWLVWALLVVGLALLAAPRNNLKRLQAQRLKAAADAAATQIVVREPEAANELPEVTP